MTDTVSEDMKLDEAGLEAAQGVIRRAANGKFGDTDSLTVVMIRAYLAATKPPLAGVTDELVSQIDALLALDAKGALVPHGIGGLARELLTRARTALASPPMPGRGEGFVLVPVEPTEAMLARGSDIYDGDMNKFARAYRAMLAASRPKEDTQQ